MNTILPKLSINKLKSTQKYTTLLYYSTYTVHVYSRDMGHANIMFGYMESMCIRVSL